MLTEKKKKIYMHKPFFLDLADMYNYIKMVLAHLMVVFHFNRIRRVMERGDAVCRRDFSVAARRVGPGGSGCFCGAETKGVGQWLPEVKEAKRREDYFIF